MSPFPAEIKLSADFSLVPLLCKLPKRLYFFTFIYVAEKVFPAIKPSLA